MYCGRPWTLDPVPGQAEYGVGNLQINWNLVATNATKIERKEGWGGGTVIHMLVSSQDALGTLHKTGWLWLSLGRRHSLLESSFF